MVEIVRPLNKYSKDSEAFDLLTIIFWSSSLISADDAGIGQRYGIVQLLPGLVIQGS